MAVVPDWIEDYLAYNAAQEAPEIFHRWAGIAVIGAVLNRRVWLPRITRTGVEVYRNFPGQISPILVAGSGKAKKSTAIKLAEQIMTETGGLSLFNGKITPEQLLHKLGDLGKLPGKQAVLCILASEFSAFLGKQSYNDGFIDILTKLADCEAHPYETRHGKVDLTDNNICLTLIGGTTPNSIADAIPSQAQQHGFLSRYIWVYSEKSGKVEPLANDADKLDPRITADEKAQRERLIIRLRAFRQLNGFFKWGDTKKWWDDRYGKWQTTIQSDGEGWPTRRWDHISRVAMVLNVSRGCSSLTFDESDLALAEKLVEEDIESNMDRCFAFIGRQGNAVQQKHILAVLKSEPVVKDEILVNRVQHYFRGISELRSQLELLRTSGCIGVIPQGTAPNRTLYWRWLKDPY